MRFKAIPFVVEKLIVAWVLVTAGKGRAMVRLLAVVNLGPPFG
jgi:hypothetical protein